MDKLRGGFSSRLGFILAAAGSAVGLGNIWGFPTQTASNGGAAFVLVYLVLAFSLAYPAFMAELLIGRYGQANAVTSMQKMSRALWQKRFAFVVGFGGIVCAALILSFYGILAGWMMSYAIEPITSMLGLNETSSWLTSQSIMRNLVFTGLFMLLTVAIISRGVEEGIEKWSKRLMPMLIGLLVLLIIYVFTLEGAEEGFAAYLQPDISRVFEPDLLISALGQAFFSLSLGTSVMIIYGSYISKTENLVSLGAQVTLIDVSIAFLAGLLIIPSMYVAQYQGVAIFSDDGSLISGPNLVFDVLPTLFNSMGSIGLFVALGFFVLMSIAALTSSISMLEGPVSFAVERHNVERKKATALVGLGIFILSTIIILNFDELFGLVISISTVYGQPLIAMLCCVFVGWIWQRNQILKELKQGNDMVEHSFFWKIWPWYTKFVCPSAIAIVFFHSL
ncbi:sodium-dependent transporter [Colwellia sp. 1_MG-2023]|uniref:sodium-dependent transporter n=1 Tax=unclassified Colwellia TaxID=196834 RepID=UPI001C08E08B|nr:MULTISPECIES: sodium-dependent transporter [unclassified Colwellia]MBU2923804.1 sodium-dependent transporter [Colwellia sp. C2M11]MDO6488190.1 sodium-dependent transporter [Colwellia sp. 6_MG-2023]MDO6651880.1 sodium-dependent transporter [Colwellia sp. 3_MG-2023]MDO6667052.1 sodium-dependent transporter [Colwellia sp. 2_MG-2023]MDO6691457.1 sodium-dependent transporter [Colwellia sp. 1_MG-2023]